MKRMVQLFMLCIATSAALGAEMTEEQVQALEAKCEAARETRLKPLRDAEIERCKAQKRNDPAYCERFYSDFGNAARRPNGTMTPRMFDDLPECVAASNARAELSRQ